MCYDDTQDLSEQYQCVVLTLHPLHMMFIRCHSYSDHILLVFMHFHIFGLKISYLITMPIQTEEEKAELPYLKKRSHKTQKKYTDRQKTAFVDPSVEEQFIAGKLYGM